MAAGVWVLLGGPQVDEEAPIPIPRVRGEGRGDHGRHVFRGEKSKASLVIPGLSIPGNARPLAFT